MTAMAAMTHAPLIDRLPAVRGEYSAEAPLARLTWFRTGGPAEVLFQPADEADLGAFLAGKPEDVAVTLLGVGSNVLIRDGGVRGVVVRLGRPFADIRIDGNWVHVGAMALDYKVATACRNAALAGLEFLAGVPGTIGGGLRMNAGAYGRELSDVVATLTALDADGRLYVMDRDDWQPRYRGCGVAADWIFTGATLEGTPGDADEIGRKIDEIQAARDDTQPIRSRTGGSTFKNPADGKAWELVDAAGCRGLMHGAAQVSEKHTNFLINTGGASAADIEGLGEEVRRRVLAHSGVSLDWEIRRIGEPA